jgi:hypothetical protein
LQDIDPTDFSDLEFVDLETRYGHESACAILRVLEQFEGVTDTGTEKLSYDERLQNVLNMMRDNMVFQTRH